MTPATAQPGDQDRVTDSAALQAMGPQVQHAINCYAGRKCKDPNHA